MTGTIFAPLSSRAWRAALVYIAAAAMLLRFFDLPRKPLHHDEGVNALILGSLVAPPHSYTYDPSNYHGPTLYYLTWLTIELFGSSTEALRIGTAAAGLGAVLLLILFSRHIGRVGALSAAALLALSPGAVYFSRYFIHEMLLVVATLATIVCALWAGKQRPFVYGAAATAGLMFATKETSIISAVVLIAAAFGSGLLIAAVGGGPAPVNPRGMAARASDWVHAGVDRWTRPCTIRTGLLAVVMFLVVTVTFYTSVFTNWRGARDAVETFAVWTKTGVAAHTQPWYAYLKWLAIEESPLLVLGVAGSGLALWRRDNRFALFSGLWMLGTLAAYSVIPYKTPWLTLNVIAPLTVSSGYVIDFIWARRRHLPRLVPEAVAAVAAGVMTVQSVTLNFVQYDNNTYPYVYAHTSREILMLVHDIDGLEALNPNTSIAVTSEDHFPLSWYLRHYQVGFWGTPKMTGAPLVVASLDQRREIEAALGPEFERLRSYRLRPGVRLVLYARRDLQRPPQFRDAVEDAARHSDTRARTSVPEV